jgi:hypothetical protein
MTGLAINTDPVRPFVLTKNESLDTAWTSYLNRHILDRREMEDLIKRIQNLGGNKEEGWDKTEELTRDQKRVLDALMRIGAREDQMEVPGSYSVKMWVVLNPTKIKRAVGRRKYEMDQTTLMGISAPAVSHSPTSSGI